MMSSWRASGGDRCAVLGGWCLVLLLSVSQAEAEWLAPIAGCDLELVLGEGRYRFVASAADRVTVSEAAAGPLSEERTERALRRVRVQASADQVAAIGVPPSCSDSGQSLLDVDARLAESLRLESAGLRVRATAARVVVAVADPGQGGLVIHTTTGTIWIIKQERVLLSGSTSGEVISDFSLQMTHLDGEEPAKRFRIEPEDFDRSRTSPYWEVHSLVSGIQVLHPEEQGRLEDAIEVPR
jgi:hypothetical protein